MRVLITGATGFIGRHIVNTLLNSNRLALLVRDANSASQFKSRISSLITGNLNNLGTAKKSIQEFMPEACIHLAWQSIPDYSPATSKLNLQQSIEFIDFISNETECKKIIISGSCSEYGRTQGECIETDQVYTTSYFSWSKQALYKYASLVCEKLSINLVWFRIFYAYGPGQRTSTLIPSLVKAFRDGNQPKISSPLNSNDFIYVDDIANAFKLALEKDADSGIYNLGSGKSNSIIEICDLVEQKVCGTKIFSEHLRRKDLSQNPVNFWSNISKIRKSIGWYPHYSLTEGIERYIQYLL